MSYSQSLLKPSEKAYSKKERTGKNNSKNGKVSFNADLLNVDLFCHLAYMSALATSELPRNILFDYSSRLPYNSSKYLREVHFMAKKLNYDYSEACRVVGEKTKETEPKALLLRLSSAMSSGEKESDFLAREAKVLGEKYSDDYERRIESLKKWTDAFVALVLSASLVVVISVVSMLIFPTSPMLISVLTWLMLMSTALGAWIMYRASPKEVKTHSLRHSSKLQGLAKSLFKTILIPSIALILIFSLIFKLDLGLIMLLASVPMLPVGFIAYLDDKRIDKFDNDIAAFTRSLGGITKAIGTTVTEALVRIDLGSLGSLKPQVKSLISSLKFGISPDLCWQRFVQETGSEQVNRTIRIFWDGISVGGDPSLVGNQSSMFAMKVSLLRAKRNMVASGFFYLLIAMHGTLSILLVGIYNVLVNFSTAVQKMGNSSTSGSGTEALTQLPTFAFFSQGSNQLQTLNLMVTAMLIVLTIVDALSIKIVEGGNNYKLLFYLGITCMISGFCLLFVPPLIKMIFGTIGM